MKTERSFVETARRTNRAALEQAGEMGLWRAQKLLVTAYDCQCMGVARDEAKAEYWRGKLNNP